MAAQCLETTFDVSLSNPNNEAIYGPPLDLLEIASVDSMIDAPTRLTEQVASFSSWMQGAEATVQMNTWI